MPPPEPPLEDPRPTFLRRRRRQRLPKVRGSVFGFIRESELTELRDNPAEMVDEIIRNRRGVRRLAYVVIVLAVVLAIAIGIFAARVFASDKRNSRSNDFSHATACLFLANIPDSPKVHEYLQTARRDYPDCPSYTPPRTPPPPTVTTTAPGKVTTRPGRPGPTVHEPGSTRLMPGPTVTRTRVKTKTRTRVRTVTATPSCAAMVLGRCVTLPAVG